jgi:Na+-driven multidrug efflux pump
LDDAASPRPPAPGRGFWAEVRSSLRGEELDYTTHPLNRAIWLLAVPMVLEMAMESAFAIVDVFFVARLGDAAVAAVGADRGDAHDRLRARIGFAMAATALVARRIGEKNKDGAVRVGHQRDGARLIVGACSACRACSSPPNCSA